MERFILSDDEYNSLKNIKKTSVNARVRTRSEIILLSSRGYELDAISKISDTHPTTVRKTVKNWLTTRFDSLSDAPRPGAPSKLSDAEKQQIITMAIATSSSAQNICAEFEKLTGKEIKVHIVTHLLRKSGLDYKRKKYALKSKRSEEVSK